MQTRNGFSLLEMLICVSLILIFASFAVPRFSSATKTAQEAKVRRLPGQCRRFSDPRQRRQTVSAIQTAHAGQGGIPDSRWRRFRRL